MNISSFVADAPAGNYTGEITLSGDWNSLPETSTSPPPPEKNNRVAANLGGSFVSPDAAATVSVGSGTTLWLSGTGQDLLSAVEISGTGNAENRGALRLDSVNVTGPVTLTGNATIGSSGGSIHPSHQRQDQWRIPTGHLPHWAAGRSCFPETTPTPAAPSSKDARLEAAHNNAFGSGTVTIASNNASSVGRA